MMIIACWWPLIWKAYLIIGLAQMALISLFIRKGQQLPALVWLLVVGTGMALTWPFWLVHGWRHRRPRPR